MPQPGAEPVVDWSHDWDHHDEAWVTDPYRVWNQMRGECPMGRTARYNDGTWLPLTYDQLQDPVGLTFWPESRGRDGCRTPMPWAAQAPHAGFSEADPWLPVGEANAARAVDRQEGDPASVLERTRAFLAWRRNRPALIRGDLQLMGDGEMVLTFVRSWEGETIFCAFNLTDQPQTVDLGAGLSNPVRSLDCPTAAGRVDGTTVHLPAYASLFAAPAADAKEP